MLADGTMSVGIPNNQAPVGINNAPLMGDNVNIGQNGQYMQLMEQPTNQEVNSNPTVRF